MDLAKAFSTAAEEDQARAVASDEDESSDTEALQSHFLQLDGQGHALEMSHEQPQQFPRPAIPGFASSSPANLTTDSPCLIPPACTASASNDLDSKPFGGGRVLYQDNGLDGSMSDNDGEELVLSRRDKKRARKREINRKRRRLNPRPSRDGNERGPSAAKLRKLMDDMSPQRERFLVGDMSRTSGAYTAKVGRKEVRPKEVSLAEMLALGYRLEEWDGKSPKVLVDQEGRLFVAMAGQPNDPNYEDSCNNLHEFLLQKREEIPFLPQQLAHTRGNYPAINVGVFHGKGTKRPVNLRHRVGARVVLDEILSNKNMRRVAGFQDGRLLNPTLR